MNDTKIPKTVEEIKEALQLLNTEFLSLNESYSRTRSKGRVASIAKKIKKLNARREELEGALASLQGGAS